MADSVIASTLTLDGSQANRSVKSFKQELREAQVDLMQMQRQFGEVSPEALTAARNVAMLRDNIQDAREVADLFNPQARFQAFGNVLRTVAGGFSALTGAAALFGDQSEELQKTLLKVQSALAISEGLNTIFDAAPQFIRLKAIAIDAFKGIRGAMLASGIGALVVILGTVVAYWDDIKELVSGVSAEQEGLLETTTKQAEVEQEKLKHISDQDNVLKLQGKTEKEILNLKVAQTDETIAAGEAQLLAQQAISKTQIETARRNRAILDGILLFLNAPLTLILTTVDKLGNLFGKKWNLAGGLNDFLADLVVDPEEVEAENEKVEKEMQDSLDTLKNQRAGFLLSIREINKKAAADAKEAADKAWAEEYARLEMERELYIERLRIRQGFDAAAAKLREENSAKATQEIIDNSNRSIKEAQDLMSVYAEIREENKSAEQIEFEEEMQRLEDNFNRRFELVKGNAAAEAEVTRQFEQLKADIEDDQRRKRLAAIGMFLGQAAGLFEQNTIAYKALAIAEATINTYLSATSAFRALAGIPIVGPALGYAAAAVAIVAGLANVKRIASVNVKSGGSSSSGGGGYGAVSAPIQAPAPQRSSTLLPQDQINARGNAAQRVYVLESDIRDTTGRVDRLKKAAVLGG